MFSVAEWIMIGGFAITIGSMIWRMAILHHQSMSNKDGLVRAHERIDEVKRLQTDRVDELSAQLSSLREVQIRMEEKLNLLIEFEKERLAKKNNV